MRRGIQRLWYRRRVSHPAAQRLLQARLPAPATDYTVVEFLAVDLEMTDLDPRKGEIVSIGYVPVVGTRIPVGEGHAMLVRSAQGVGESAVIHGIRDRDVGNGLPLDEALVNLIEALTGRVLLLHHRTIDLAFLNRDCRRVFNMPMVVPVVDTMALERRRLAMRQEHVGREELRLYRCRERYNLPAYRSHDALVDALATAELFLAQAAHIASNRRLSLRKLLRWSAR
jgi:DNA polymerase-3 subunit epsilon